MLEGFSDALIARIDPSSRFTDSPSTTRENSHEISVQDLNAAFSLLQNELSDQSSFCKWFGAYMTQPKYPDLFSIADPLPTAEEVLAAIQSNKAEIALNPGSRLAFTRLEEEDALWLFVDGRVYGLPRVLGNAISKLCELTHLNNELFIEFSNHDELLNVLLDMLREGSLLLLEPAEPD